MKRIAVSSVVLIAVFFGGFAAGSYRNSDSVDILDLEGVEGPVALARHEVTVFTLCSRNDSIRARWACLERDAKRIQNERAARLIKYYEREN